MHVSVIFQLMEDIAGLSKDISEKNKMHKKKLEELQTEYDKGPTLINFFKNWSSGHM